MCGKGTIPKAGEIEIDYPLKTIKINQCSNVTTFNQIHLANLPHILSIFTNLLNYFCSSSQMDVAGQKEINNENGGKIRLLLYFLVHIDLKI